MGLGDLLSDTGDWLSRLGESVSPFTSGDGALQAGLKMGAERAAAQSRGENPNELGAVLDTAFKPLGVALEPATHIPGWDSLMTALDVGRRGIDTVLISAQHADAAAARQGKDTDWAEFFNTSTWSRAWDYSNYENADRVTGGQYLSNLLFNRADSFGWDPFDALEAEKLQQSATSTWYGRTLATTTDLGESLVSVPGAGVIARGRQATGIATLADAERVAQRYNDVGATGRTGLQKIGDTAKVYMHPSGSQNADALIHRQVAGLREFDGKMDELATFNKLKARLETAPDGEIAKLANVFTEINKVADPATRERLRVNTWLAGLGSSTAKRALIEDAPLLAKNFENLTVAPRETGALTELYAARLGDGGDLPINDIVERVWNTTGDKAEMAALKDEIFKRRTALTDHDRLVKELKALKPAPDSPDFADWKAMTGEAMRDRTAARTALREGESGLFTLRDAYDAKVSEIAQSRKLLDRKNALLSDILDVAGKDSTLALVGDAKPTALNALKANMREWMGADSWVTAGDGNTMVRVASLPKRAAKMALHPSSRGMVDLNEIGLGSQQMGDALARSKAFAPEEIRKIQNSLIRTQGMDRIGVVKHAQEEMLTRVAQRYYEKRIPGISREDAMAHAKELTNFTIKHWGQGNDWVAKAANEQVSDGLVMVRDLEGAVTAYDGPTLRSQLADNAPMLDPWQFEQLLKTNEKTIVGNIRNGVSAFANLHEMGLAAWKVGALLRPGLAVRSMLDTGPRALASLSAAESLIAGMNGAVNLLHNRSVKGLAKVRFSGLEPDQAAAKMRYLGTRTKRVGKGKYEFQMADDVNELQGLMMASSRGQTVHSALFHDMAKRYDGLKMDRSSWKRNKPDSQLWHVSYKAYADQLLASPTARRLGELLYKTSDDVDVSTLREALKDSPEFTAEYRKFAQPEGMTRSEFLQQIVHEFDLMFPDAKMWEAAKNGGLTKKFIDRNFPREARFEVPSPEFAAVSGARAKGVEAVKRATDSMFRTLLDKPDMWLGRNPVMTQMYGRNVQREIAALEAARGPGATITANELKLVHERAKGQAIGYVRNTFFDTTRYTGAHRVLTKVSPFIAAWEDAMMSWGRLVYDDPRRLTKLAAAYHSPYTIQTSNDIDLVVDENGQRIGRGADADGVFVKVPLGAFGRKIGVPDYRFRLDAINAIAQGETFWLPGVGPNVSIPAAYVLGSGHFMSREAALDLIETDDPLGKALLKSVYLGGELPEPSAGALAKSALPGWVKTLATEAFGTGRMRTQKYAFNYYVAEATRKGEAPTGPELEKMWERAGKSAIAAATVRLVAGAGVGLTGSASIDGQFYVDQMRIIDAMDEKQRGGLTAEEFFAKEYPEAADLNWSTTKNETGIVASVNAAKAEARLEPILRQTGNKQFGWMILGKDNVVETEFSRTAYGMQRADGSRTYLSAEDSQLDAMAAVGWRQFNAWSQQLSDRMLAAGFDEATIEQTDQYRTARRAFKEYLVQNNPAFAKSAFESKQTWDQNYNAAKRFSSSGPLAQRSDMVAFRDYDAAREQVMATLGIGSFEGKAPEYEQARAIMREVGTTLAKRDIGFSQMWDRFLEKEVD